MREGLLENLKFQCENGWNRFNGIDDDVGSSKTKSIKSGKIVCFLHLSITTVEAITSVFFVIMNYILIYISYISPLN